MSDKPAPYSTPTGKKVCLCPECRGQGYDPAGMFFNGGLRRPCPTCLLVGFVYLETGEHLTDNDGISVMRQAMNRMNERIGYLSNRPTHTTTQTQQHFGPNQKGYRGD